MWDTFGSAATKWFICPSDGFDVAVACLATHLSRSLSVRSGWTRHSWCSPLAVSHVQTFFQKSHYHRTVSGIVVHVKERQDVIIHSVLFEGPLVDAQIGRPYRDSNLAQISVAGQRHVVVEKSIRCAITGRVCWRGSVSAPELFSRR